MDTTVKIASLISFVTSVSGKALSEDEVSVIIKMAAELRADHVTVNRLLLSMKGERKIDAIKEYRTLTGSTLLDAKNAIESSWPVPSFNSSTAA